MSLLPSHRQRGKAFVIDAVVVVVVFGLALALDKVTDLSTPGVAVAAVAVWVYYVGATVWLMDGQSAGKTICELRVSHLTADRVPRTLWGLAWSIGRHTVGYVVVDVFLVGTMFALLNRQRRCLHDYAFASQVTYVPSREAQAASSFARYRSYWEDFAERYDELTRRNRWFFFPWKWLSKAVVIAAVLVDKVLPAKSTSSTGAVPTPVQPAYVLSAKATAGVWAGAAALTGLIGAASWPDDPDPPTTAASGAPPVIEPTTTAPGAPSVIETTDFGNYSYEWTCVPGLTVHQLVDGEVASDLVRARFAGVYRHDLDGDNRQDAIVNLHCGGGNTIDHRALFAFTDIDGQVTQVGQPFNLDRGRFFITGDNTFESYSPGPGEPRCCPTTFEHGLWMIDLDSPEVFVPTQPPETIPADQMPEFTDPGFEN